MKQQTKTEIMDQNAMRRAITRMSYEVLERNSGSEGVVLVGIKTRGVFVASRIADKIGAVEGSRPPVFTLDITAFRDDRPGAMQPAVPPLPAEAIEDKIVVLVDDVLYTGRTVRAALDAILHAGRARCVQLAALIDRGHREVPIRPDYIGKNLPTARTETVRVHVREVDGCDEVLILTDKTDDSFRRPM